MCFGFPNVVCVMTLPPVDVHEPRHWAAYTYIALSPPYFKRFDKAPTGNYISSSICLVVKLADLLAIMVALRAKG